MSNFIIEIGQNHKGSSKLLSWYVKKLAKLDIYGVTFQVREREFYNKYPDFEISKNYFIKHIKYLKQNNKKVGIALCDINLIDFFSSLEVDFIKVLYFDINNFRFIDKLLSKNFLNIFLSTGNSPKKKIDKAIKRYERSSKKINIIQTEISNNIIFQNLKSIKYFQDIYKCNISYGHHCSDKNIIYTVLAFEPNSIFLYVKNRKFRNYFDDSHAFFIDEIKEIIKNSKLINQSLGKYGKPHQKDLISFKSKALKD